MSRDECRGYWRLSSISEADFRKSINKVMGIEYDDPTRLDVESMMEAVRRILKDRKTTENQNKLLDRVLEESREELESWLGDLLTLAPNHPEFYRECARVMTRALRGELVSGRNPHPAFEEACNQLSRLLAPAGGASKPWVLAWDRQKRKLEVEE